MLGGTELFKLFGTIGLNGVDGVEKDLNDVSGKAEGAGSKMVSAFKKVGAAVATYFSVREIVNFGKACVDAAASVAAETAAFGQIMGEYSDKAQKKIAEVADATGITDSRLTPYMTSMTAKFKGLGYGVSDATGFAQRGLMLAADASAFWDKSLDDSMSHLNSFINGSYEGGEAIGLFANDTQLAAYAVEKSIVSETKEWAKLDEATKQATRLEYAENMMKQSGATGQAAKEAGAYANVQGNLNEAWRQFKATVGEPILNNLVIPAMQKLTGILPTLSQKVQVVIEKIKQMWNWYKENSTIINTLVVAVGAFVAALATMNAVNNVIGWVKNLISTFKTLYALMMANPIGIVIAAITALVAAFLYLWNNCEGFRNFWINLWNKLKESFSNFVNGCKNLLNSIKQFFSNTWNAIKTTTTNIWNGIKDAIMKPIETARDKIKAVIDKIKGFFTGFSFSWPKIPLPHFGITPSGWKIGDLLKGSIPKLGIEWYAKGAVLENPTAFGINGNNVMVGGEAGKEAVAPITTLQSYVKDAVRSELGIMESYMIRLVKTIDEYLPKAAEGRNVVLDTGVLVGAMGSNIDYTMGNINRRKERWG